MSGMEPDVRDFLVKIATSLSMALLWMLVNTTIGIGFNYAFFQDAPTLGNYIFYVWLIITFVALVIYLRRKWKV